MRVAFSILSWRVFDSCLWNKRELRISDDLFIFRRPMDYSSADGWSTLQDTALTSRAQKRNLTTISYH